MSLNVITWLFYSFLFHCSDHQNFVGVDDSLGPIVVSLRRERVNEDTITNISQWSQQPPSDRMVSKWQFRVILRTSEVSQSHTDSLNNVCVCVCVCVSVCACDCLLQLFVVLPNPFQIPGYQHFKTCVCKHLTSYNSLRANSNLTHCHFVGLVNF